MGRSQPAAVGVQTEGSVYGLTVAGTGLIAYVDPAFRVGTAPVDLVLAPPGGPGADEGGHGRDFGGREQRWPSG